MSTPEATAPLVLPAEPPNPARPMPAARTRGARWGGWLLALSPLSFVLVIIVNAFVFATTIGAGTFADITREQMNALGVSWALVNIMFPLAVVAGSAGALLVARSLVKSAGRVFAWASIGASILVVVGFVPYAPFRIAAMGFTEPTLGENPYYTAWDLPYTVAFALAPVATALLCAALYASGIRRTAAVVIGALSVVVFVCFAIQLPLPPFVIAFLWCALGIAWLRAPRQGRVKRARQ